MPSIDKVPTITYGGSISLVRDEGGAVRITRVEQEYTFAFELRNAARVMANNARRTEEVAGSDYELRAFVHGAVVLAYASLEAALNEMIHLNALRPSSPLTEANRRVLQIIAQEELQPREKSNTLQKFNLLLRILDKSELNASEATYQRANLVRLLRNMLIHPVPGKVLTYVEDNDFDYSSQQDIVKKLRSHLGLNRNATFPDQVLIKECASWAVESTETFLHEFVLRSGIDPGFITAQQA